MKNNVCKDKTCRYRFCKLHPLGYIIKSEEERILSGSICRKQIADLVNSYTEKRMITDFAEQEEEECLKKV